MEQELWPNHRGVFVIKAPSDMPLPVIVMLQATIGEAWVNYDGDPNNPEQFFNHLVGDGMANVPRETSPVSPHDRMIEFLAESDRLIAEQGLGAPSEMSQEDWEAHMRDIARRATESDCDVPRETSGGDDVAAE